MKASQSSGDNSINVASSGSVNISTGMTYSEVRSICHDMIKDTFSAYAQEVRLLVAERNELLIDELIEKAQQKFGSTAEERLSELRKPEVQYAVRQAQLGYCRYGDSEAKEDATDIIISRISQDCTDSNKFILDDAIERASKITDEHAKIISSIFTLMHARFHPTNLSEVRLHVSQVAAFLPNLPIKSGDLSYLSSIGLLERHHNMMHWKSYEEILQNNMWAFLSRGFDINSVPAPLRSPSILMLNGFDKELVQPNCVDKSLWENQIRTQFGSSDDVNKLIEIANKSAMTIDEIHSFLLEVSEKFAALKDELSRENSGLRYFNLTPVGTIIAHARSRRFGFKLRESPFQYIR